MSFPLRLTFPRTITVALVLAVLLAAVGTAGAQGVPGIAPNKCLAGKTKCVNKKIAGLFKCREKCQADPAQCLQPGLDCFAKVVAKFDGGADPTKGCFAKLEAKADPSRPASVCLTTGDSAAIETQADAVVLQVLHNLEVLVPCQATTGGFCWFLGADGANCTQTCTSNFRTYDSATDTYAGASGTDVNCQNVMFALDPLSVFFGSGPFLGLGCAEAGGTHETTRDTSPIDPNLGVSPLHRACACQ